MSDDRRLDVLRAIVEDYVATQEPVGSKALVERHHLGVSPATIRNDMAVLEDEGYIAQPHTSAGRIPTDKGYRMFVDRLATVKALSAAERRAIETFLTGAVDVDDVVQRSVRVLAQLTNQIAIVQYPSLTRLDRPPRRDRRRWRTPGCCSWSSPAADASSSASSSWSRRRRTTSSSCSCAATSPARRSANGCPRRRCGWPRCIDDVRARPTGRSSRRSSRRCHPRVHQRALRRAHRRRRHGQPRPVRLRLRHRHPAGARGARGAGRPAQAARRGHRRHRTCSIGAETGSENLVGTAVVSSPYGADGQALATLGTLGPTRMDYPGTMAAVGAVARYVGRLLNDG